MWLATIGIAAVVLAAGCGTEATEPTAVRNSDLSNALTSAPKGDDPAVGGMMGDDDADRNVGGMMGDDDANRNVGDMMDDDKTKNPASTRRTGMMGGMMGMMGKAGNGTNVEMDADDMPVQECLDAMKDLDEDAPKPEAVRPAEPDDEHGRHHPDKP